MTEKTNHEIPEPYVWDESFCVFFKQLDDQHKGLFQGIFNCCGANNEENLNALKGKVKEHFVYEEAEFARIPGYNAAGHKDKHDAFLAALAPTKAPLDTATVDYAKTWLVNHIKNTDFTYKLKIPDIPEPFVWDESFCVFYHKLDEQHRGLFQGIFDCCKANTQANLDSLKQKVKAHFVDEESEFKSIDGYDFDGHKANHDAFLAALAPTTAPLDAETVDYAKKWLVNHIKNSDFTYKGKITALS